MGGKVDSSFANIPEILDAKLKPEFDVKINAMIDESFDHDVKKHGVFIANIIKAQWIAMKPHLFFAYCLGVKSKGDAMPEWISTSERIPKEGEEVLVHHLGQIKQATKDKNYYGGFKSRNCYGWESVSRSVSHWMPKSIALPSDYNFYYENDAKNKAMIEAQEQGNEN